MLPVVTQPKAQHGPTQAEEAVLGISVAPCPVGKFVVWAVHVNSNVLLLIGEVWPGACGLEQHLGVIGKIKSSLVN